MSNRQWKVARSRKLTGNVIVAQLTDGPSIELAIEFAQFERDKQELSIASIQVWRTRFQIEHVRRLEADPLKDRLFHMLERLKAALKDHKP